MSLFFQAHFSVSLRQPSRSTLFPYTTLFRSLRGLHPDLLLHGAVDSISFSELRFRSEEHTSELQSRENLVCRLLLEKNITASKIEAKTKERQTIILSPTAETTESTKQLRSST